MMKQLLLKLARRFEDKDGEINRLETELKNAQQRIAELTHEINTHHHYGLASFWSPGAGEVSGTEFITGLQQQKGAYY